MVDGEGLRVGVALGETGLLGLADGVVDWEGEGVGVGVAVDPLGAPLGAPLGVPLVEGAGCSVKMSPSPKSRSAGPSISWVMPKAPSTMTTTTAIEAAIRRQFSFPMLLIVAEGHEMQMRNAAR